MIEFIQVSFVIKKTIAIGPSSAAVKLKKLLNPLMVLPGEVLARIAKPCASLQSLLFQKFNNPVG